MIHSEGFLKIVNDARSRVKETTPEVVRQRQQAGQSFHFVDVREDNEWQAGRAAGALARAKEAVGVELSADAGAPPFWWRRWCRLFSTTRAGQRQHPDPNRFELHGQPPSVAKKS